MRGENKGSILLWSIFLVVFIIFSFLYISDGITKQIYKNKEKIETMQGNIFLDNHIMSGKNTQITSSEMSSISFYNFFESTLKQDETIQFLFSQANTGSIEVLSGGPIYFETQDSTANTQNLVTTNKDNIPLSDHLMVHNLGGMAKIHIDFATASGITFPYNFFQKIYTIGGTNIIKENGILKQ